MKYKSIDEAFELEEFNVNEILNKGVTITEISRNNLTAPFEINLSLSYKGKLYRAQAFDMVIVLEKSEELMIMKREQFDKVFKECEAIQRKTMNNSTVNQAKDQVKDIQVYGDGDTFRLLCKASSEKEGWMKSTKVSNVDGGCIVQVTTQQRNHDGTNSIAEAMTFVPGNRINIEVEPRRLERIVSVSVKL